MSTQTLSSLNRAALSAKEGYWWINGVALLLSMVIASMSSNLYGGEVLVAVEGDAIADGEPGGLPIEMMTPASFVVAGWPARRVWALLDHDLIAGGVEHPRRSFRRLDLLERDHVGINGVDVGAHGDVVRFLSRTTAAPIGLRQMLHVPARKDKPLRVGGRRLLRAPASSRLGAPACTDC